MKKFSVYYLFFSALSLLLLSGLFAQDAPQDPLSLQQTSLSSAVRSALLDSKRQMDLAESYSNSLRMKIDSLEAQSLRDAEELTQLSTHLTNMTDSFRSLFSEFSSLNISLELEKQGNRRKSKANLWLGIILGVMWLLKLARVILGFAKPAINKFIPLWLDILI